MRTAAHYMSRNLSAGMAMITCKDQLMTTIQTNVKNAFLTQPISSPKELVELAANQIASDNVELVCAFIQKSAIEKCQPEIDKLMQNDYDMRKQARQEGRRYCDPHALTYQAERMPEALRLKVGAVSATDLTVYEEFGRNVPGFQRLSDRDLFATKTQDQQLLPPPGPPAIPPNNISAPVIPNNNASFHAFGADEIGLLYDEVAAKIDTFMTIGQSCAPGLLAVQMNNMHALMDFLVQTRRTRDNSSAINLLNKAVEGLMEGLVNVPECTEPIKLYRDIHLRVLRLLQDARAFGSTWTSKAIARCMIECRENIRFNKEAVDLLISTNYVHLQSYDAMLAQLIESRLNFLIFRIFLY